MSNSDHLKLHSHTEARPDRSSNAVIASNFASMAAALAGLAAGIDGLWSRGLAFTAPGIIPPFGLAFHSSELGSFFTMLVAVVSLCVAIYNFGYAKSGRLSPVSLVIFPLFIATLEVIPLANAIPSFLFFWELMALESLALVLDHHQRVSAQRAALLYAIVTQFGFFSILAALALIGSHSHGLGFSSLRAGAAALTPSERTLAFLLALVGFGSKAGLVPLHAWLPKAHPEAPAPASALMSTAMVSLGIYGLIKFGLIVLAGGPAWWGLLLLGIGAVSSVYGVIESSVSSDLKVLLAYSTTENMGLVAMAAGTDLVMAATHHIELAFAATLAMVFLLGSHAVFKGLEVASERTQHCKNCDK